MATHSASCYLGIFRNLFEMLMAIGTMLFEDVKNVFFFVLKAFFALLAKIRKAICLGGGSL